MKRLRIEVEGIVQGVGFRPFVYNLAREHGVSGFVRNDSSGVFIEAQGDDEAVTSFLETLRTSPPQLAEIESVNSREIAPLSHNGFTIRNSVKGESMSTLISPDVAICPDCTTELFSPNDRRYQYPFINCTNCGPRYSIISEIPYDRPNTSMAEFEMCRDCTEEYHNPADRRFHAQPNACPECGPWLTLFASHGEQISERANALDLTRELLKEGNILAIKGLGGFHLACDATSREAVNRLRDRKAREEKPLAVMMRDLETARRYADLTDAEERSLTSPQSPILLALKKGEINEAVAPGNPRLGVMLPYTPLHHLLFGEEIDALVMTSGNYTEEPICIKNDEAMDRLGGIAEYLLMHNREILQRVDDSVVAFMGGEMRFLRRSRGYVPRPIPLMHNSPTILGVGAELKNTLCYTKGTQAFVSQHIGDLANTMALDFFHHTRTHLGEVLEVAPEMIVYDMHPGYLATNWAQKEAAESDLYAVGVQHHHAHMASAMMENQLVEPVIGLNLDGTGYGTDGSIWGGEVLVGDYTDVRRFAHFETVPLPGGDKAIREPWRMGLSYLWHAYGNEYQKYIPDYWKELPVHPVSQMIEREVNTVQTSSAGRLFDGVAALAGGRTHVNYEAQAAMELEFAMTQTDRASLEYEITERGRHFEVLISPIIRSVIDRINSGADFAEVSTLFHQLMVRIFTDLANRARRETGIENIVLSGGVFQNYEIFSSLLSRLSEDGFQVYTHRKVPANDGGISLGQVAVGQALYRTGRAQVNYGSE